MSEERTRSLQEALDAYGPLGVDVEGAIEQARTVELSVHCWQGDDVRGTESAQGAPGGGLAVTGQYPGRARTPEELRLDLDVALSLAPGRHRLNLHAIYAEPSGTLPGRATPPDRATLRLDHFAHWLDWAEERGLGIDFNATLFGHPMAASGLTLAHPDAGVRRFWVDHVRACRSVGAQIGRRLGTACLHDLWIPDGSKDECVDRQAHRLRLLASLDEIYAERHDPACLKDALESKLFGIGSESFVVGSHELYLGYCQAHGLLPCLDLGHFHPTESVADKISALLPFHSELLLHLSRGVRWDSDHVVVLDGGLCEVVREVVRCRALERVHLALDYFDATINRVAAWVVGMRATRQALLQALLEPIDRLRSLETDGDYGARLALLEHVRTLPWAVVWSELCRRSDTPAGLSWLDVVREHEVRIQRPREA